MTFAQVAAWPAAALADNGHAGLRAATLRQEDKEHSRDWNNMLGIERRTEAYDVWTAGGSQIRISRVYVELR